ncbi:unnamed protein product, partial [Amoebophrya sp. A120]
TFRISVTTATASFGLYGTTRCSGEQGQPPQASHNTSKLPELPHPDSPALQGGRSNGTQHRNSHATASFGLYGTTRRSGEHGQ